MSVTISGSGQIIKQVVQTFKSDTFSMTGLTYTDVTGLSVSITPTNALNKILIIVELNWGASANDLNSCQVLRNSTPVGNGDVAGSRSPAFAGMRTANPDNITTSSMCFLDSPATTSATTYKVQIHSGTTNTLYVNRTATDTDANYFLRASSSITVMEVAYA